MNDYPGVATGIIAMLVSLAAVFLVEKVARRRGMLDRPTWRSSHSIPTPRLGGLGIVAGVWVAVLLGWQDVPASAVDLMFAATALSAVGLIDDIKPLSSGLRLAVQLGISLAFVLVAAPGIVLDLPSWAPTFPSYLGTAVAVIWLVGVVNVWNFMDGLDGLAGGTAAIAAVGLIAVGAPASLMIAVAAACLGFLVWNHAQASIFMGDNGSVFLGFMIGGALLARSTDAPLLAAALLLAPFLLDASYTFCIRLARRRPVFSAHHEHLYQRWASTGADHRVIAASYWFAAGACALAAPAYLAGGPAVRLGILAAAALVFGAYVLAVHRLEAAHVPTLV